MADGDINLSALWVPVMAETSHIKEQLKRAGEEGKTEFLAGFANVGNQLGTGLLEGLRGSNLTGGMTAILTGGVAGMVSAFTEKGLDIINEAFEKTIDLAKETAEVVLEIGESWHQVGREIELNTTATGAALEALNRSAENVVRSGLDTSMKGLGDTMAALHQRIGLEAGPALEQLTKHVLEAQDRFGQFKAQDFAAVLHGFGVSGQDADQALASLVNAARATDTQLSEVIAGAKQGGPVFRQMGLDVGQAGAFVAQLSQAGIDLAPVLKGMQAAEKEFAKEHISMSEGLKDTLQKIDEFQKKGDTKDAEAVANKIFGPRAWATVLDAMQKGILDTNTVIAALGSEGGENLDQLFERSQNLGNKFQELKNQASEALKPLGETAISLLEGPLEQFKGWFDKNHDKIVEQIKDFGDKFIDLLPQIEQFAEEALHALGPFLDFFKQFASLFEKMTTGFGELYAVFTGNDKLYDSLDRIDKTFDNIADIDLTKKLDGAAGFLHDHMVPDSDALHRNLQDSADAAENLGNNLSSLSSPFTSSPFGAAPSGAPSGGESPSTFTSPTGQQYQVAPSALSIPLPPGGTIPLVQNPDGTWTSTDPEWAKLIKRESGGNPTNVNRSDSNAAAGHPSEGLFQIIQGTWESYGGLALAPTPLQATPQQQAQVAANILRANPSGSDWGLPGGAREDPQRLLAGLGGGSTPGGIALQGNNLNFGKSVAPQQYNFDCGPAAAQIVLKGAGISKTQDDLIRQFGTSPDSGTALGAIAPALNQLVKGGQFQTFQGSQSSPDKLFNDIKSSIDAGFGGILNYNATGVPVVGVHGTQGQVPGFESSGGNIQHFVAVEGYNAGDRTLNIDDTARGSKYTITAQNAFDLTRARGYVAAAPSGGKGGPEPDSGDDLSKLFGQPAPSATNPWINAGAPSALVRAGQVPAGQPLPPLITPPPPQPPPDSTTFSAPENLANAPDNLPNALVQINAPGAPGGPSDSSTDDHMPGRPYIPMPVLTGNATIDSRNLDLVNKQIEIERKQEEIGKELDAIATMQADPTTDPKKLSDAQQKVALDQSTLEVDKERFELDKNKPLTGKETAGEKGESSAAERFGSGFLKGILSDFGFGNVLGGKSPMDWGIVKLLGGLAGWGLGEANAWGDALSGGTQSGTQGLNVPSTSGGLLNGLLRGATGLNLPKTIGNVALGPSAAASPLADPNGSIATGRGQGPPPGPVTIDQSFNVTQHGVDGSGVQDWKEAYNSQSNPTAGRADAGLTGLPALSGPG